MTVMRRKEMTVKSEHQCVDVMRSKKETSTMMTMTTERGRPAFWCERDQLFGVRETSFLVWPES